MKNLSLIVFGLISFIGFGQEIATTESGKKVILNKNGTYEFLKTNPVSDNLLTSSDFKLDNGRMVVVQKNCQIKNGDNKNTEVIITVGCKEDKFKTISIAKINEMLNIINDKSISATKNKYTYNAKIIKLSYLNDSDTWHSTIEYTAQNDYGATKDGLNSATFQGNGEFVKFSTIL